ncbi:C4-dicarboxylate ABC transporter permease [Litchfieldella qijiaojingensis]|uniref:TRAP transporter small permease protein n=1 Tax=Litchfieldella qijiaojingensis TaxID=980347 RepID=A0ABQ2YQW2_9GAMM|nr:TRAP transporter small permease [Halomonas qijiaojingensis]GGX91879.1 C4-dicarboxylate ABC transporter permease [Halomonas qijiaojingensis]
MQTMTTGYLARPAGRLNRASRLLAALEQGLCSGLIVAFSLLLMINVITRYAFNSPLFFAEELAVYILIWMAFLAISLAIHHDQHVRLTMLVGILHTGVQRLCYWLTELLCLAILAVLLWHSIGWIRSPSVAFDIAITLDWPKWHFYLIVPIFCATSIFHILARLPDRSRTVFALASDDEEE